MLLLMCVGRLTSIMRVLPASESRLGVDKGVAPRERNNDKHVHSETRNTRCTQQAVMFPVVVWRGVGAGARGAGLVDPQQRRARGRG